jgi:signal peptidase II
MKLFFPVASLVLALDFGIKQLMLSWLFFPPQQIIVTPFFSLTPVWNSGISFGLFSDNPYIGLVTIPVLAVLVVLWLIWQLNDLTFLQTLGASFIAGGALGNVSDRIVYGRVIDFLDFHIGALHWPAFNVADSALFIGVLLWFYGMMQPNQNETL